MKTISLFNSKGGTGKTTFSVHLAAGLAMAGKSVVLIDADSQGNSTTALSLPKKPNFYDLIVRGGDWRDCLSAVHPDVYSDERVQGQLFVVNGNVETGNIPNSIDDETIIMQRLQEIESAVDYVIFDTSPTASLLHSAIHAATDYLILPTQLEGHSALEGLPESMARAESMRSRAARYGLDVCNVLGIVPNMHKRNTITHDGVLDHIRSEYGELVWEPVSSRIVIPEANLAKQLVYRYAPKSDSANDFINITNRVLHSIEVPA